MALDDAKFSEEFYDAPSDKTWDTSFNVDGVKYVTNLFWQPLENPDDPYADVEQASQNVLEGADLFCVKRGKSPQFGICVSSEGYDNGNVAAASSVATSLSNLSSFVAVFKVDKGWWYVCVRNDIILSDGDMLFVNEEDAKTQFESMLAVPDWNKKFAPSNWGFDDVEQADIADIISGGDVSKLKKIGSLRGGKLTAVFVISGVFVLWILYSLVDSLLLTPKATPIITVAPKRFVPAAVVKKESPAPWTSLYAVEGVMVKCYNSVVDFVSVLPPGWEIGNVNCKETFSSASWARKLGLVSWFDKAIKNSKINTISVDYSDNGEAVKVASPFGKQILMSSPPSLTASQMVYKLNNLFQSLGVSISLSRQTKTEKTGESYNLIQFSFSSAQNPLIWNEILTKFSGVSVTDIVYSPASKSWQYKGVIYVL
ncbi:MAG: type 4b pilus protein PilO2 [Alphaproteobacteria bacterium]